MSKIDETGKTLGLAKVMRFGCIECDGNCKLVFYKKEGAAAELSHAAPHCERYERQTSAEFLFDVMGETYWVPVVCTDKTDTPIEQASEVETIGESVEPSVEPKTPVKSDPSVESELIADLRMQVAELRDENAALRKDCTDLRAEMHRRLGDIERSVKETQPPPPPDTKPDNLIPPAQG